MSKLIFSLFYKNFKASRFLTLPILNIIFVFILCLILVIQYSWKGFDGQGYMSAISSDGRGYYMYLPNIFINKNIASQKPDDLYILEHGTRGVNKYYVGTAIAMSPFFVLAYMRASVLGVVNDGYSAPFHKAISFAGLFYLVIGLFFLIKLLKLYHIQDWIISFIVFVIVFGTNLLTYAVIHPSMSHIYSWCFITAFLYFSKKTIITLHSKDLYIAILLLGIIVIIRPLNGLILLVIPFLSGSFFQFKKFLSFILSFKIIAICSIILFLTLFIQSFIWYIQSGCFFLHAYQDEGFYFLSPQIWNVLFSFRKGLFIYTPILIFAIPAFILFLKKNRFAFFTLLFFLLILVYFISSWWNWYYGPSFGQRPFVEF